MFSIPALSEIIKLIDNQLVSWTTIEYMESTQTPRTTRTTPRFSYAIGRMHRLVRLSLEETLAPLGLTVSQYTAMSVLATHPGLSNAELARRVLVTPQAMTQALSSLIDRGVIERTTPDTNRRMFAAELSEKGLRLLDDADARVDASEDDLLQTLTPDELDAMMHGLVTASGLGQGGLRSS